MGIASSLGLALACGVACVLPAYEGSSGESGAGGGAAQGDDVASGFSTSTSDSSSSGAVASSGAGASTSGGSGGSSAVSSSGAGASTSGSSGGSGGSGGSGTVASSGAGGATSGSSAGPGGGDDVTSSATSVAASSSSSGGGTECLPPLDPCVDVEPFDFADQEGLEERFDVDQSVAEVQGGRLRLDPSGDEAVLKAKQDAAFDVDCAVWIMLHTTNEQGQTGLGLGDGSLSGASLRVQRDGDRLVAQVQGGEAADAPFDAAAMRHVRIRVLEGDAYFDYAADPSCWTELSGPHPLDDAKPTLFHAGPGNARLDDYCID